MGNAIAEFLGAKGELTDTNAFAAAISGTARQVAPTSVDGSFLKLHSDGFWAYGQAGEALDVDSVFAVNPMSLRVGYCAWKDMVKIQEHMAAIGEPPIIVDDLDQDLGVHSKPKDREGQKVTWDPQMSVTVQGVEGEDTGLKLLYNTTSHGGRSALAALMEEVSKRVANHPVFFVPLVKFDVDSYQNKTYRKTVYTPVIDIVGWGDVNGNIEATKARKAPAKKAKAVEAPKPRQRRRRVA